MQKYTKGDLVRIAPNLGAAMSHFTKDCNAIVIGSYAEQYGGDSTKTYTLHLKGQGESSWYEEHQLTLIEEDKLDLLEKWKKEETELAELEGDLNWIFTHGKDVLEGASGSTITALADCLSMSNLWGSQGEGVVYFSNALFILGLASRFLLKGDKEDWLKYCKMFKEHAPKTINDNNTN